MSKKTFTEEEYERIAREACEHPWGADVVVIDKPNFTEKDYLYAVWRRLAKFIGWDTPMLPPKDDRSEVELLRDEIHKLVASHQSTNYAIQPTLYKYISAALENREGEDGGDRA